MRAGYRVADRVGDPRNLNAPLHDTSRALLYPYVIAIAVGLWLGLALSAWRRRARMARARRTGRRGETRALRLLRARGYRIVAREVEATVRVRVDGRLEEYAVRADALVRRHFRRYVVEIKTGASAAVSHRRTRRQLLEYAVAFGTRHVLLVDADHDRIRRVEFPGA